MEKAPCPMICWELGIISTMVMANLAFTAAYLTLNVGAQKSADAYETEPFCFTCSLWFTVTCWQQWLKAVTVQNVYLRFHHIEQYLQHLLEVCKIIDFVFVVTAKRSAALLTKRLRLQRTGPTTPPTSGVALHFIALIWTTYVDRKQLRL